MDYLVPLDLTNFLFQNWGLTYRSRDYHGSIGLTLDSAFRVKVYAGFKHVRSPGQVPRCPGAQSKLTYTVMAAPGGAPGPFGPVT
ncbi:unnamed protein product [Penicillium camemberti]|uniref:Str. FM013 n=1 Tax=Penicillium camemberti (strain FM 013) TaxID=1429867 RepID=A0A0G4PVN4_PENC3|nr:unnamed protein product [Penicillium camemberti]